jgi:hypothetical protein
VRCGVTQGFAEQLPAKLDGEQLMFQNLIPMTVHLSRSMYSDQVDKLVQEQLEILQGRVEVTKGELVSMNLPAALDALDSGSQGLSEGLVAKINAVVQKGGLAKLREQRAELERLQASNASLLQDSRGKIKQEEADDDGMRQHYGHMWQREPSRKLTAAMVLELDKYEEQLARAGSSDALVVSKLSEHEAMIAELSQGVSMVEASLPGASQSEGLSPVAMAAVTELREYLGQLNVLLTAREPLQMAMKATKAQEDNAVLNDLLNDEAPKEDIFEKHIAKYDEHKTEISRNTARQTELMKRIESANARFVKARPASMDSAQLERKLADLNSAADAFIDVEYNLREGTEFYQSVNKVLLQCQERVTEYVFARADEKASEMAQLNRSGLAAAAAPSPASSVPAPAPFVAAPAPVLAYAPPPAATPPSTPPAVSGGGMDLARTQSMNSDVQRLQQRIQDKQKTVDYLRHEVCHRHPALLLLC